MNIPIEPAEILKLDLGQIYTLYQAISLEDPNPKEQDKVDNGYEINFHIMSSINQTHYNKYKSERMVVNGNSIKYKDYYKEIEKRKATMIRKIYEHMGIEETHEGR